MLYRKALWVFCQYNKIRYLDQVKEIIGIIMGEIKVLFGFDAVSGGLKSI